MKLNRVAITGVGIISCLGCDSATVTAALRAGRSGIVVDEATLRTDTAHIYAIGDCMSINGVACRYVAPLRAQAATIADDILGHEHSGYDHKPPMIRLKNKAISVMVTGVPNAAGNWQVKTESDDELIMDLLDDTDAVSATVTIKAPATPKAS